MTITKKTKFIITISLIAGSLVICGICALSILLPSYLSWKSYYDNLIGEWDTSTTTTTTTTDDDSDDTADDTESASKVTLGSTTVTLEETVVRSK